MKLGSQTVAHTLSYSLNDVSRVLKPLKCRYKAWGNVPLRTPIKGGFCAPP